VWPQRSPTSRSCSSPSRSQVHWAIALAAQRPVSAVVFANSFVSAPRCRGLRSDHSGTISDFTAHGSVAALHGWTGCRRCARSRLTETIATVPPSLVAWLLKTVLDLDMSKDFARSTVPALYLRWTDNRLVTERSWPNEGSARHAGSPRAWTTSATAGQPHRRMESDPSFHRFAARSLMAPPARCSFIHTSPSVWPPVPLNSGERPTVSGRSRRHDDHDDYRYVTSRSSWPSCRCNCRRHGALEPDPVALDPAALWELEVGIWGLIQSRLTERNHRRDNRVRTGRRLPLNPAPRVSLSSRCAHLPSPIRLYCQAGG